MGLVRSRLLKDGYSASGEGAHEAEVSYMRKLGFSEVDVRLINDLRFYRNGILYYGKIFNTEYANKIISFLQKNYEKLVDIAKSK